MRPIHRAGLDKRRYALLLTPVGLVPYVSEVTVAPITSGGQARYRTQLPVGPEDGLDHPSVIKCESIQTIPRELLGDRVGQFPEWREFQLRDAVLDAFGLPPVFDA